MTDKVISYYEFAAKIFLGKELFNKRTGYVYMKWEAYHRMRYVWELIVQGLHTDYGMRDKPDWRNGVYTGRNLRQNGDKRLLRNKVRHEEE